MSRMETKQFYILLIIITDIIAILLDQVIHKKLSGESLGIPYYIYIVYMNVIFLLLINALE